MFAERTSNASTSSQTSQILRSTTSLPFSKSVNVNGETYFSESFELKCQLVYA